MKKKKNIFGKIWYFIWEEDSMLSWIVNLILAFILIKFIVYPGLGFVLGTEYPIVAVVSRSMEHDVNFDEWWLENEEFYQQYNIHKSDFEEYKFKNGFNKGDIMILTKAEPDEIRIGQVIVFDGSQGYPIIHRVIRKLYGNNEYHFTTKGDNNPAIISKIKEEDITEDRIFGKAVFRIPYLGYVKVAASCGVDSVRKKENLFKCIAR